MIPNSDRHRNRKPLGCDHFFGPEPDPGILLVQILEPSITIGDTSANDRESGLTGGGMTQEFTHLIVNPRSTR